MDKERGTIGHIDVDSFWMPRQSSTVAADVDFGYNVALWVNYIFFFIVVAAMLYFVWKYRHRKDNVIGAPTGHNTAIEIIWSVIPLAVLMGCFIIGFRGYLNLAVAPKDAYEIQVTAKKWSWTFTYPNGKISPGELHVPAGQPVRMVMSSVDVIHSFFVPEFRVKQDVIPGMYTSVWFEADEPGEKVLFCTEFCGKDHSNMLATVVVHSPDDFQQWLEAGDNRPPAERGQALFSQYGCVACHTVDGTPKPGGGPTLKGSFGHEVSLVGGATVVADENYLRESILVPAAKVVEGFPPIMPAFQGQMSDQQVNDIIAYIKSLQ